MLSYERSAIQHLTRSSGRALCYHTWRHECNRHSYVTSAVDFLDRTAVLPQRSGRTVAGMYRPAGSCVALILVLAACSSADSPSASPRVSGTVSSVPSPSAVPTPVPTPAGPAHDPASILLQFDATPDSIVDPYGDSPSEGIGGNLWYVPGPDFTMYGDGTVIFRDDEAARANRPADDRSFTVPPLSIGHLTADQVEEVLDHAWAEGGLAEAKEVYETGAVDLFISATFTINADERSKHVDLRHLSVDQGPDAEDRERLVALADYLRHLDTQVGVQVQPWQPDRYWGSLHEVDTSFTGDPRNTWPWDHIGLEGWVGGRRSLLPSEVEALGIGAVPGGYCCHLMSGPTGDDPAYTGYGLSIEPIHPEPILTDAVAEVVTNDLIVRTAPGTDSATSEILRPTLDAPQKLYVVDGPVAADGFDWYLVQPFAYYHETNASARGGWVAAAGQDGEPWIAPSRLGCVPANDLYAIARTSDVLRVACSGNETLELEGTFDSCSVRDGVAHSPDALAPVACTILPDPYDPEIVPDLRPFTIWLQEAPSGIRRGQPVRVEGHFDDPVAGACATGPAAEGQPNPELVVLACRAQFISTALSPGQ
jgi:hypothetical protein